MAPSKNLLKEFSEKSRHFTVKVKIIEKVRPQVSPNKTKYQRIRMKDDKICYFGYRLLYCLDLIPWLYMTHTTLGDEMHLW